ncbi:hypothetical protein Pint_25170 [Pistacia integerrima]|uniref:Uncharacterized protein n=1 Tax=Pistacia integerrima TaxID=434235 RepID=A0ACC0YHN1_9ROSI|nr:hypothetical protein Pint_25170 [Pistacia integerrima]
MEEIARGLLNKNKEGKIGWLRKNSLTAFKEVEVPLPDSLDRVLTKGSSNAQPQTQSPHLAAGGQSKTHKIKKAMDGFDAAITAWSIASNVGCTTT